MTRLAIGILALATFCSDISLGDDVVDAAVSIEQALTQRGVTAQEHDFHGFTELRFSLDDVACRVVLPKSTAKNQPWVWRARFYGHQPQFDIAMLERGWHVCYCDVSNLYGSPKAVERWNVFHRLAVDLGLSDRPFLEGMSRGGLIIHNWAKANPSQVCGIYGDNAVCDGRSWPGAKGTGKGSAKDWQRLLKAYGSDEARMKDFDGFPINGLAGLAKAKVPILHINGTEDNVVPPSENSNLLIARYKELGGPTKVIWQQGAGHHPHSLKDPTPIVEFALKAWQR